ncbi:hypothetical protein PV327_010053 [Microctonus hyperodae]|uniref:Microtubule-associated protein futsch n=1 Tax=Microctonus hyperodae TaxID=165561 RepID=A0AA39F290_MICHY|nr:hypothetical protein PV327_010053 [Microctonus hyperodae]
MNPTRDKGESEDGKSELAMNENMATSTVSMNTTSTASPFQQHPPPSPLSGCYLLVVLPEPHTAQHKDLILNRLAKGFLSWDKDSCHVDLTKELQALVAQSPEGEEARNGERLIQYATENLVTEILIHPQTNTLLQCIRNLLASFTKHRHIIHAGYTFNENGSWILQDGTFSLADFLDAFNEHDVQRVLRAYENSVTIDINCANIGDWSGQRLTKDPSIRSCRIRLNPDDILTAGMPAITNFTNYISQYLVPQGLDELMRPSDVVGNIRFSHPTLYVFPGGQGDAALFGINGFNMLVDGGFARKSCFWDFTRHLDRLDAVLFTRLNNSNIGGMSSVLKKKKEMHVYPQIGHFFCNLVERKHIQSPDGDKDLDPLVLSLIDLGQEMMTNLRHINLRPYPCYRNYEPINLYHKVGHGTLDMYVLSPTKDSREVKDFLTKWNATDWKLFASSHKKDANNMIFPIQNLVSICALLIWQPANPDNTITRILFPGSTPQHKIFEGLQRLNHLEFLKHPTCTAKSISPSTSLVSIKDKAMKQKLSANDKDAKRILEVKKQKRETVDIKKTENIQHQQQQQPLIIKTKKVSSSENKKLDEVKDYSKAIVDTKKTEKIVKEAKKEMKKDVSKNDKETEMKKNDTTKTRTDNEKFTMPKISKNKIEQKKKEVRETPKFALKSPKTELKSSDSAEQMVKTSTPKKIVNASASKAEISKTMSSKLALKSTAKTTLPPAKSTKDANNRKVVEQKNIEKMSMAGFNTSAKLKSAGPPAQSEKKAVTRQVKTTTSPGKSRITGSPVKSGKTIPISAKSEKTQIIKKVKSEKVTADPSSVSTPSVIEIDTIKYVDKNLTEKSEDMSFDSIESKVLADLKEEREVVEEIEAVLKKAERKESVAADTEFEGGAEEETTEENNRKDEDMTEDDITADIDDVPRKELPTCEASHELTEEDEYLIIEKEEIYTTNLAHTPTIEHQNIIDTTDMEKNKFDQSIKKEVKDRAIVKQPLEEEKEKNDGGDDDDDDGGDDDDDDDDEHDDDDEDENIVDDDDDGDDNEIDEEDEDEQVEVEVEIDDDEDEVKANILKVVKDEEDETGDDYIEKDVEKGILEEREKTEDDPEKSILAKSEDKIKETTHDKCTVGITEYKEQLEQEMKGIITSAAEIIQKTGKTNETAKKDDDDVTKESPSLTTEQLGSSEKKTIDVDVKPDIDLKEPCHREKLEESQERISTIESGATTTAPTLPEDERIPAETFNRNSVEKQMIVEDVRRVENVGKAKIIPLTAELIEGKSDARIFGTRHPIQSLPRDIVKTPDEVADLPVHEEVDPKLYEMGDFDKSKEEKLAEHKDSRGPKKVFGFLGKVTDKTEKGMDKLAEKSARDIEKDIDEKSSSKSTSPKELNDVVKAVPEIDSKKKKDIDHNEIQKEVEKNPQEMEPKKSTKEDEMGSLGDTEDVEALLEEASKKFKSVKDSLRDSLESLEEPIIAEEFETIKSVPTAKADEIKETLDEVAEKLEEITFASPKSNEIKKKDIEEQTFSLKDVKEAMRDVGEVLAGTAGIVIETPPKDVIEIVKKVAEVLKEDDFLSEKTPFIEEAVTNNQEENPLIRDECNEPPCIKQIVDKKLDIKSSENDDNLNEYEKNIIHSDVLPENVSNVEIKSNLTDVTRSVDTDDGIKHACEKEDIHQSYNDNKEQQTDVKSSDITFDQKSQPVTAELVVVTPDSLPESAEENLQDKIDEIISDSNEIGIHVPMNVKDVIHKTEDIDEAIERLILVDKIKITIEILEYIVYIKRIPGQKVTLIIRDIINRNKIASNFVDPEIFDKEWSDTSANKELEIEEYINDQYIKKSIKITYSILDDIATKKSVPISIVVKIIQEIILKKHIKLDEVLCMDEKELQEILEAEEENTEETKIEEQIDINNEKKLKTQEICQPSIVELQSELENEFMTEYINKGQKITDVVIININQRGIFPQQMIIKVIDEMIIARKLLKQDVDISASMRDNLKSGDIVKTNEKETINLVDNNLVHDFVIVPSNDNIGATVQTCDIEMTVSDDFEAVEQEYKSSVASDESKVRSEVEEAMEDDIHDVEEADDKIVTPISEKTIDQVSKIALADEALEIKEAAIVQHELPAKLPEKKENELQLTDSFTDKQETVTSLNKTDDKLNTVKRLMVTATSEEGSEETELCASDNTNITKPSTTNNLLNSPIKIMSEQETVCSRASTPEIDSVSATRIPGIEISKKTFEDSSMEGGDITKAPLSPLKKEQQVSMTDAIGQIIVDDKSHQIHEGKPIDIPQLEHASPVGLIPQKPSTVNSPEEMKKSPEHDGSQNKPEGEQKPASKLSSDHAEFQDEMGAIGDRPISISIPSITHDEKEKSLSPTTDSTVNMKDSEIAYSKTTPTNNLPKMIEEHVAETIEPEKKSPIPSVEDLKPSDISTDNSVHGSESSADKSPQLEKKKMSDDITPNLTQDDMKSTPTLINESSPKIDGLSIEPTFISGQSSDELKCRITTENESQVLPGFSPDKRESHISSDIMHLTKIGSPVEDTRDKSVEYEGQISVISQKIEDDDNDGICQANLVKQIPCSSKTISPTLSKQDENMEDPEQKVNDENSPPASPIFDQDLKILTLDKPKDLEIDTKVIETTSKSSASEDLLTSPEHHSQKNDMVENEKSPDVARDSLSPTSQVTVVTETEKEITNAKSESYSDNQNKSTILSISPSTTDTSIITVEKEKSLSPKHEKSISPKFSENKSLESSPGSQLTPSNENITIEQKKVPDATPSSLSPDSRNIGNDVDKGITDDKSPDHGTNQLKTMTPSPVLQSPEYKTDIICEKEKSPSPIEKLPEIIPSTNKNEINEKITNEISIAVSSDQNTLPVSSPVPQSSSHDENIIVEKKADMTQDLHDQKEIEDIEKISKKITDTKSTDQNKSPIVSPVSQPQIIEENIIHVKEKSPSPTSKSSTSIADEDDSLEKQKSINELSTSHSTHQIELEFSPAAQSPSRKESIGSECEASLSLTHQLSTQTLDKTVSAEIDGKTTSKQPIIHSNDQNMTSIISPECYSSTHEQSIITEHEKPSDLTHELLNQTSSSSHEKEVNEKVTDKTIIHPSADEIDLTSSASPIAQASYHEENIKPSNLISQSPSPTLITDQIKSSLSPAESGLHSPDKNTTSETKDLPPTTADLHHVKSSKIEDMETNKNVITTQSTTHSTPAHESSAESPIHQSPIHEKSINDKKEKTPSPILHSSTPTPSATDETKIIKEMDDKKPIISTTDHIMSPVSSVESQSPSRDENIINEKEKLPSPIHEFVTSTPDKRNEKETKEQIVDDEYNLDNTKKSPVPCLSLCLEESIINEKHESQSSIQEKRSSITSKTDDTEVEKEMNYEDSISSSIDQNITSLPCKSPSASTPSHSPSRETILTCQEKESTSQQLELISHQTEDIKTSKDLDHSQISSNKSDENLKLSIFPAETSLDITEKTKIISRDRSPDLSLSISSEVKEANSTSNNLVGANDNDVDVETANVSPSVASIQKENMLTDDNTDHIQQMTSPLIHSTSLSRKESIVDITDKNAVDSKPVTSLSLKSEGSVTSAMNYESQSSTAAEILSSSASMEKIVHEGEPLKLTESSIHHLKEDDSTIDIKDREDYVVKAQADSAVDKDDEPLQDRSSSRSLFEADKKMPEDKSGVAALSNDKEEIFTASISKTNDNGDANLESAHDSTKDNIELSHISIAKRISIEDYITEVFIKPKKKISMKLLLEMANLKEVTIDIILVIIEYFISEKNIPIELLVDDELISRIEKDLALKVTNEIEVKKDDKNEVKEEDIKEIDSFDITEQSFISEEKKLEIEKYLMENHINKGKIISPLVLKDMEKIMAVPRYVLLEIIIKIATRLKLPEESICDDIIYSEISSKKDTEEHSSGKSTPERKSSGYSTPIEKNYHEKFESQFHKVFVDGMTEIRTTHITTLSGKSTPDVSSHINYPDSELSDTKATATEISQCDSHVVEEISGPVAMKHTIISSTEDSPECKTVIKRTIIEQEILEKDSDVTTHQIEEIANIKDTIQEKNIDEQSDQHDVKKTVASPVRHDYIGSLMSDSKSGRSTPDKLKDISDRPFSTTPEGFRAGEIIKTIITTTRTVSEEGEIITTTKEVTETTNEKGETTVMTEKVDVIVADRTSMETDSSTIEPNKSSDMYPQSIMLHSEEISLPEVISGSHSSPISEEGTKDQEGQQDSDNKMIKDSSMSITSQVYHYEKCDEPVKFSTADMSSSFYGQLPDIPPSSTLNISTDAGSSDRVEKQIDVEFSSKQYTESIDYNAEKPLQEKSTKKRDDDSNENDSRTDATSSVSKDPLQDWGTPLKLPPPERPEKFNLRTSAVTRNVDISPDSLDFDVIHDWGEPMRLPSPTQIGVEDTSTNKIISSTMKKDVKQPRKVISENLKNKKYLESPIKSDKKLKESKNKVQPIYLDLTYVPHHGNSYYASLEFFKRIRARYYVFSGTEPSREVYDALLNAKKTWENKNLEVTIIPTYDTDTLGYWVADNEEALAINHIDLSPSASRCTINLQDHETSCSAYRLEF